MGEVLLNQLGIFDAGDHLHGTAGVLTGCKPNTFAKAKTEMPVPMRATRIMIFELRSPRLE